MVRVLLETAYMGLGFKLPWVWEENTRSRTTTHHFWGSNRNIGSTYHMLIELYLDMDRCSNEVPLGIQHRVQFVVICLNQHHAESLESRLAFIHRRLSLRVNLRQVEFRVFNNVNLAGSQFVSWGVFCDHMVKEQALGLERAANPYRFIREIKMSPVKEGMFDCYDRENKLVCQTYASEINDILKTSECPVTFTVEPKNSMHFGGRAAATAYPAWAEKPFQDILTYKPQFEVPF